MKVYDEHGNPSRTGTGIFPRAVMQRFPLLPLEEEGRLVAQAGTLPWEELIATYGLRFMEGLALLGTRRKHVNVLQHLMGYLKKGLSSEETTSGLYRVGRHWWPLSS